jgi:hypothetical protein
VSEYLKSLCTFSLDLNWFRHIEKITNICEKYSGAIKLLRQYLDINELVKIVRKKIMSKLLYAVPVWLSESILRQK